MWVSIFSPSKYRHLKYFFWNRHRLFTRLIETFHFRLSSIIVVIVVFVVVVTTNRPNIVRFIQSILVCIEQRSLIKHHKNYKNKLITSIVYSIDKLSYMYGNGRFTRQISTQTKLCTFDDLFSKKMSSGLVIVTFSSIYATQKKKTTTNTAHVLISNINLTESVIEK